MLKIPPHDPRRQSGPEAVVNARIAQSDRHLREIQGLIAAHVPWVDWPLMSRAALGRALAPAPDENLNPAEWRKVEAVRFWVRIDAKDLDRLVPRQIVGDPVEFAYLVDRLRADLASGWDRPQVVR